MEEQKIKKKIKRDHNLENNPCWKLGIKRKAETLVKLLIRAKVNVSECSICHKKIGGYQRNIHHKDKDNTNNELSNLVVCCPKCHKRLDCCCKYSDYAEKHNISPDRARYRLNKDFRAKSKKYYQKNKEKILKKRKDDYQKKKLCSLE